VTRVYAQVPLRIASIVTAAGEGNKSSGRPARGRFIGPHPVNDTQVL